MLLLFVFPQLSDALSIIGAGSLGDFTGELTYSFTSFMNATLIFELTNTSPIDNGGFLTAFVFNNPQNQISNVTLFSTDGDFNLLGGSTFNNKIKASPFGNFDIGASTSSQFSGGGNPNKGIGLGVTETFNFSLTGTNLDLLTSESFVSELSVGASQGQGNQFFLARFRGFDDGGSNKTPGGAPPAIPEPSTYLLFSIGILGVLVLGWRPQKKPH